MGVTRWRLAGGPAAAKPLVSRGALNGLGMADGVRALLAPCASEVCLRNRHLLRGLSSSSSLTEKALRASLSVPFEGMGKAGVDLAKLSVRTSGSSGSLYLRPRKPFMRVARRGLTGGSAGAPYSPPLLLDLELLRDRWPASPSCRLTVGMRLVLMMKVGSEISLLLTTFFIDSLRVLIVVLPVMFERPPGGGGGADGRLGLPPPGVIGDEPLRGPPRRGDEGSPLTPDDMGEPDDVRSRFDLSDCILMFPEEPDLSNLLLGEDPGYGWGGMMGDLRMSVPGSPGDRAMGWRSIGPALIGPWPDISYADELVRRRGGGGRLPALPLLASDPLRSLSPRGGDRDATLRRESSLGSRRW